MRLKDDQIRRLAEKVYNDLQKDGLISVRGERTAAIEGIFSAIRQNFAGRNHRGHGAWRRRY